MQCLEVGVGMAPTPVEVSPGGRAETVTMDTAPDEPDEVHFKEIMFWLPGLSFQGLPTGAGRSENVRL
ncbi:hypothetical protein AAFF_G00126880 [Aldrovandia affinis]|uniref:Uncharacterized protein n=1 Tax=Aldrovandia affinis TaxID=143900 RepID=A0AAD7T0V8_9TELE|nr:hypothetical protein AAFF_G00126880 [Aldrovandia affinis]